MPVYEYKCKQCGREFEYQQRMSDPDMTVCEACGGALERLISRTAFQLKGSGWYKDLYSSSKPESGGGGEAKADSGGDAKPAESKPADAKPAESKPAAAPAAAPAASSSGSSGSSSSGSGSGSGGSSSGGSSGSSSSS